MDHEDLRVTVFVQVGYQTSLIAELWVCNWPHQTRLYILSAIEASEVTRELLAFKAF